SGLSPRSWEMTISRSAVTLTSSSNVSMPIDNALAKAGRVFSGKRARPPRCASISKAWSQAMTGPVMRQQKAASNVRTRDGFMTEGGGLGIAAVRKDRGEMPDGNQRPLSKPRVSARPEQCAGNSSFPQPIAAKRLLVIRAYPVLASLYRWRDALQSGETHAAARNQLRNTSQYVPAARSAAHNLLAPTRV